MKWFEELIIKSSREKYSDIHITGRQPRVSRKNGKLHIDRTCRCNGKKIDAIVRNLSNPLHLEMLKKDNMLMSPRKQSISGSTYISRQKD